MKALPYLHLITDMVVASFNEVSFESTDGYTLISDHMAIWIRLACIDEDLALLFTRFDFAKDFQHVARDDVMLEALYDKVCWSANPASSPTHVPTFSFPRYIKIRL